MYTMWKLNAYNVRIKKLTGCIASLVYCTEPCTHTQNKQKRTEKETYELIRPQKIKTQFRGREGRSAAVTVSSL